MNNKKKALVIATVITAGSAILGSTAQATPVGTMDGSLQITASQGLLDQVKGVNVNYEKLDMLTDPLQTGCGVNCSC